MTHPDTRSTYFAVYDVDNISVVRGFRAPTPFEASILAEGYAVTATRLTGREWTFKKLGLEFPHNLIYDAEIAEASALFAKRFQTPRER